MFNSLELNWTELAVSDLILSLILQLFQRDDVIEMTSLFFISSLSNKTFHDSDLQSEMFLSTDGKHQQPTTLLHKYGSLKKFRK